ncbi:MAG: hypothetical protein EP298_13435 [Gammaproteobacteria bacterium]|nr:MAG: hypothetical protein EP298_13435 [Gammaproteobacteria bacterium]UTW41719.1 hypothetical protein KFE69_09400 [bacterium SCSIO 12844]
MKLIIYLISLGIIFPSVVLANSHGMIINNSKYKWEMDKCDVGYGNFYIDRDNYHCKLDSPGNTCTILPGDTYTWEMTHTGGRYKACIQFYEYFNNQKISVCDSLGGCQYHYDDSSSNGPHLVISGHTFTMPDYPPQGAFPLKFQVQTIKGLGSIQMAACGMKVQYWPNLKQYFAFCMNSQEDNVINVTFSKSSSRCYILEDRNSEIKQVNCDNAIGYAYPADYTGVVFYCQQIDGHESACPWILKNQVKSIIPNIAPVGTV